MNGQSQQTLYSVVFELQALSDTTVPKTMGHLAHALFLNLIKQFNPQLSARLHDEPGYRPFTISPLYKAQVHAERLLLKRGQSYYLRVTLLDGGAIWHALSTHFLETGQITVILGEATLHLIRMLTSSRYDPTGWASTTTWSALGKIAACSPIEMHFSTPTAFSEGKREFALVPKPTLLWESLVRVWNRYAPADYAFPKEMLNDILRQIGVSTCDLHTTTWRYPTSTQKGFIGTCTYQFPLQHPCACMLTTLAAFAQYAGVGYKTTMGMGQARAIGNETYSPVQSPTVL